MKNEFFKDKASRISFMIWLVGLILGLVAQDYAYFVLHNPDEGQVFSVISIICSLPLLIVSAIRFRHITKKLHELQVKMWVTEEFMDLLKLLEPGRPRSPKKHE